MIGFVERRARVDRRVARAALLVRVMVGWVFLTEGMQKFLYPAALGVGRFSKIGIPSPEKMAPFVGVVEIVCGVLLLVGFGTALAVLPLLIDIAVAIATTKAPMLMKQGFWATMHEGRTDFCMVLGLLAVWLMGAGAYSLDALVRRRGLDGV
jgi:putative oxidoreductase